MNLPHKTARHERGQLLVIVAVGMVVILAMVGVVIDGGYAWGKQRELPVPPKKSPPEVTPTLMGGAPSTKNFSNVDLLRLFSVMI